MMLGDTPWGLFGPKTSKAFGHLGFTNNFLWADPERAVSVTLLTARATTEAMPAMSMPPGSRPAATELAKGMHFP